MALSHLFTALGYLRKQEENVLRGLSGQSIQQIANPTLQIGTTMQSAAPGSYMMRSHTGQIIEVPFSYSK